jgi:hypothetical protein
MRNWKWEQKGSHILLCGTITEFTETGENDASLTDQVKIEPRTSEILSMNMLTTTP